MLDGWLDRHPPRLHTRPHMVDALCGVMGHLHCVDACALTHGTYSLLEWFLVSSDMAPAILRTQIQDWFLLDHAPLSLDWGAGRARPWVPLWCLHLGALDDALFREELYEETTGYFDTNWLSTEKCGLEWDTLKVVKRGECLSTIRWQKTQS
ncbi:hypothetical protein NDU88_002234 [Pleurodeles waltl]|uniref:Uncharacterized protein n=1 Tax=Pleurodeles waltl TaxID=8319 RepID=A0AAV7V9Y9_PLEWA|nr:hypothetical protein NDU88_002234 [Pleurodeles waltl]